MAGNSAPIVNGRRRRVVSNEHYLLHNLISTDDRDGDDIVSYRVRIGGNGTGGSVYLNGVKLSTGTYRFSAADFAQLTFQALLKGRREYETSFRFRAYDGKDWSEWADSRLTTRVNANRPIIRTERVHLIDSETSIAVTDLYEFFDEDASTVKRMRFRDKTGGNGGFYVNGRKKTGVFQVNAANLDNVRFVAADEAAVDQIEIAGYDGRFWSTTRKLRVQTIGRPELKITYNKVLNQQEDVDLDDLFVKSNNDKGPDHIRYEIYDATGGVRSGGFFEGIDALNDRTFHSLTPDELSQIHFQGGKFEVRSHDYIFVRADNGSRWSRWEKFNVNTEPEMINALASSSWFDYRPSRDPLILSFSFLNRVPTYYDAGAQERTEFMSLTNELRSAARLALLEFEKFLNIRFVEQPDNIPGDITFGMADLDDTALAWAYFPTNEASTPGLGGDVWYNWFDFPGTWLSPNVGPGSFPFEVTLHELGHALGEKHPFDGFPVLPRSTDHTGLTVMSYTAHTSNVGLSARSPMLYDVAALQSMYGANTDYESGDTFWSYGTDQGVLETIWDTDGEDTLTAANQNTTAEIDLRQGQFSSIGRHPVIGRLTKSIDNVGIAYGVEFENATGGRFGDTLIGNELSNKLRGNAGNDTLRGNQGKDFMYGGDGNDTYVYEIGDGDDIINDAGRGRDTLEIHWLKNIRFRDLTFRRIGKDLLVDLTIEGEGSNEGTITIKNSTGSNRIESLQLYRNGNQSEPRVDLTSVYVNAKSNPQNFSISNVVGDHGFLAEPIG